MSQLWQYCTKEQYLEFLVSLSLIPTDNPNKYIKQLYSLSNTIDSHYHLYQILKKDGSMRHLCVPDVWLKNVQENILHHILYGFSISEYATAYYPKMNIMNNAEPHQNKSVILKMDICNFFDNITYIMVYNNVFSKEYFPQPVAALLTTLCCYHNHLPQGAPTSAAISNLVMKSFDESLGKWCCERNIAYTRYCDDLTFSGDFNPIDVKRKVASFLNKMGFYINHKKTRILRKGQCQRVTGIVVNEKMQVMKQYRKQIRQEIYYCEKYGVVSHLHHCGQKDIDKKAIQHYYQSLLGKVNFILQVNPNDKYFQEKRNILLQEKYKIDK